MIKEHDRVVLTAAVPDQGLKAGDVGTVVHLYEDGRAYEVEFVALDGHTAAVVTLEPSQVRPVARDEITHALEKRVNKIIIGISKPSHVEAAWRSWPAWRSITGRGHECWHRRNKSQAGDNPGHGEGWVTARSCHAS